MKPRIIAFYLPQFHPINENSEWWGPGFTEWHNVAKARPLYKGHVQPKLPGELGFYDLRLIETQEQQANLAKEYGVYGFCYWHYWFGGKRILERPLEQLLEAKHIDLPFCLGWANESWTGIWHGQPRKTLIDQTYPEKDAESHYAVLRRFFLDDRYIKHNGRPVFYVYKPKSLKNSNLYLTKLRELAKSDGFPDLHILGTWSPNPGGRFSDCKSLGLDAAILTNITGRDSADTRRHYLNAIISRIENKFNFISGPKRIPYDYAAEFMLPDQKQFPFKSYHTVISNWDNTPRSGRRGLVLTECSAQKFEKILFRAINVANKEIQVNGEQNYVFLKSWNEWAEGNFVEPSFTEGRSYLEAIKSVING